MPQRHHLIPRDVIETLDGWSSVDWAYASADDFFLEDAPVFPYPATSSPYADWPNMDWWRDQAVAAGALPGDGAQEQWVGLSVAQRKEVIQSLDLHSPLVMLQQAFGTALYSDPAARMTAGFAFDADYRADTNFFHGGIDYSLSGATLQELYLPFADGTVFDFNRQTASNGWNLDSVTVFDGSYYWHFGHAFAPIEEGEVALDRGAVLERGDLVAIEEDFTGSGSGIHLHLSVTDLPKEQTEAYDGPTANFWSYWPGGTSLSSIQEDIAQGAVISPLQRFYELERDAGVFHYAPEDLEFLILNLNGRFAVYDRDADEVIETGHFGRQLTDIAQGAYGDLYAIDFSRVYRVDAESGSTQQLYSLPFGSVNALTVFENNGAAQAIVAGGGRWSQIYIDTGVVIASGSFPSSYQSAGDVILLRDVEGAPTEFVFSVNRFGQNAFLRYDIDEAGLVIPDAPRIEEHPVSNLWGLANGRDGEAFFGFAGRTMSSFEQDSFAGQSLRDFGDVNLTNISGSTRIKAPNSGLLDGTHMQIQPFLPNLDSPHGTAASVVIAPGTSIRDLSALFPGLTPGPVPATVELRGEVLNYTINANSSGRYATAQGEAPFNGFAFTFDALRENPDMALRSVEVIAGGTTLSGFDDSRVHHDGDTLYLNFDDMAYGPGARLGVQMGFEIQAQPGGVPISGGTGPDQLRGTAGDDVFLASAGNDFIDGVGGFNTVVYSGLQADYSVLRLGAEVLVDDQRHPWVSQGADMLRNIQELVFADGSVMLDAPPATAPDNIRIEGVVQGVQGVPMTGVSVTVAEAGAMTDALGTFGLELAPGSGGMVTASRAYDPLVDPAIRATDALQVLRLAVGLEPGSGPARPEHFIAADTNGDGQVTAADALEILRHAVGLPGAYSPEWVFVDATADLSAERGSVAYAQGVSLPEFNGDMSVAMTGILVGSLSEFA